MLSAELLRHKCTVLVKTHSTQPDRGKCMILLIWGTLQCPEEEKAQQCYKIELEQNKERWEKASVCWLVGDNNSNCYDVHFMLKCSCRAIINAVSYLRNFLWSHRSVRVDIKRLLWGLVWMVDVAPLSEAMLQIILPHTWKCIILRRFSLCNFDLKKY